MTEVASLWLASGTRESHLAAGEFHSPASRSVWLLLTTGLVSVIWGEGHSVQLRKGDAIYLRRSDRYAIKALEESTMLEVELVSTGPQPWPEPALVPDFTQRSLAVVSLLSICPQGRNPEGEDYRIGYAQVIAGAMCVALREQGDLLPADSDVSASIRAVRADPAFAWNVAGLARISLMGRSAFVERFHAETGLSPMKYVRRERIAQATGLLSSGGRTVAQVSAQVGYCSVPAFVRAFSAEMGTTPGRWRTVVGATIA